MNPPATKRSGTIRDTARAEPLWSVKDVSEYLGIPVSTLHQWRYHGSGPDAYRVGRHLRYNPSVVRAWLDNTCRRDVSA